MPRLKTETSAGGLVIKRRPLRILMVRVRNLEGRKVWTFPKGHLEKGETARQAALREVREETGWRCRVPPRCSRPLLKVRYFFMRGKDKISKRVIWFLMDPVRRAGSRDPREILRVRWASMKAAVRSTRYPSDKKILKVLHATIE